MQEKDNASVVKSVNTSDLKSDDESLDGSSPSRGTKLTWKDKFWWAWVVVAIVVGVIDGNLILLFGACLAIFAEFAEI